MPTEEKYSNDDVYSCPLCEWNFTTSACFQKHLRLDHLTKDDLRREHVVAFDVDDTLVMWREDKDKGTHINQKIGNGKYVTNFLVPHERHIKILKTMKERGHYVIVWSAGGALWADAVVDALGLGEYVDLVIAKPGTYFDDKPASQWMGEPEYVRED